MRVKIREILDDCIADGLRNGYRRAHKYDDEPCEETMISYMEDYIWLEIDRKFDFERNVCDEVVKGFDQLEKEREWVGITDEDYEVGGIYIDKFLEGVDWAEAKLKEKNT